MHPNQALVLCQQIVGPRPASHPRHDRRQIFESHLPANVPESGQEVSEQDHVHQHHRRVQVDLRTSMWSIP
jgi:hypothetical protein